MVCYTAQVGCDSVPPSAAGADCSQPACVPETKSACIPRYDAPCKADADCGAGFSCLADQVNCACASAGSAPGSSADGGSPPPPPPVDCQCPPSTTSSCHALPVTCASAADCAAGWTRESTPQPGCAISEPAQPPAADGGAPTPPQDAGIDPCPPPPPAAKLCVPPYYSLGGGSLDIPGASTGEAGGTPTSGRSSAAGTPPKAPSADSASGTDQTSTSAGCSVAHGTSSSSSGFALLALGLFGWLRRRRQAAR